MSAYLYIEGIEGAVTAKGHAGWIAIEEFQYHAQRNISVRTGSNNERKADTPSYSSLTLMKKSDQSSGSLAQLFHKGSHIGEVVLALCHQQESTEPDWEMRMRNVFVAHYQRHYYGEHSVDYFRLSFDYLLETYHDHDARGGADKPYVCGYNMKETKCL